MGIRRITNERIGEKQRGAKKRRKINWFKVNDTNVMPAVADGDSVASETSWKPLKSGGASFQSHKLVVFPDTERAAFIQTEGARWFYRLFWMGWAIFSVLFFWNSREGLLADAENLFPAGILTLIAVVLGLIQYTSSIPFQFCKQTGYFWKGRTAPSDVFHASSVKSAAELADIHALQLLRQWIQSQHGGYMSYQLNLVMKDASRRNMVSHAKLERLREDAARLATFLERPLWDGIEDTPEEQEGS